MPPFMDCIIRYSRLTSACMDAGARVVALLSASARIILAAAPAAPGPRSSVNGVPVKCTKSG